MKSLSCCASLLHVRILSGIPLPPGLGVRGYHPSCHLSYTNLAGGLVSKGLFFCSCSTGTGKRKSRPNVWCEKAPGLSDGQRKVCHRVPGLQTAIKKGIEKGLSECERAFKWSRWNCTLLGEKNLLQRAPGETCNPYCPITLSCLL